MKKFKSVLSRLLILALMISSFAILGCPNPNDANPDVGGVLTNLHLNHKDQN